MVDIDKAYIAMKVKLARKKAGLKQNELAKELGITSKQVSRIEQAMYMPSLPSFLKMVAVLKLDLKEFGIESIDNKNPIREEILKIINVADDNELKFYLECLKTMSENINLIK